MKSIIYLTLACWACALSTVSCSSDNWNEQDIIFADKFAHLFNNYEDYLHYVQEGDSIVLHTINPCTWGGIEAAREGYPHFCYDDSNEIAYFSEPQPWDIVKTYNIKFIPQPEDSGAFAHFHWLAIAHPNDCTLVVKVDTAIHDTIGVIGYQPTLIETENTRDCLCFDVILFKRQKKTQP